MESIAQEKPGRQLLTLLLAAPRGFCAGVERAIRIVELSLQKYGAPVYVRHEIVHNKHVVERLKRMGAIFIDDLCEAPDDAKVIFSAHGVPKSVPAEARRRKLFYLNATCPLVSKVHVEAERHHGAGRQIVLIGHAGHPEVEGTLGQLAPGAITLIETVEEAQTFEARDPARLAFITQTTLSVDDTEEIVAVLRRRFPLIAGPHREDICYATTNRQEAVKRIAPRAELVLVIGAPNSSNSLRLVEVAQKAGARNAMLIQGVRDIDWSLFEGVSAVGLSAGASTPDILIDEAIAALRERFDLAVEETTVTREDIAFNVPRALAS
ncbi:MAG TPA: 4-hydroxy-3-methylbut-2-enyl diphosphate reductase [Rhizomicrobium sp.]|nr:4-hydroxy-3-methylbut-2-enyl diphosphate reductase [Rhizomicrobium sp.]